jgi:TonB family protein
MHIARFLPIVAVLVGCASDGAKYTASDGIARSRAEAEQAFAENPAVAVQPEPFDRPVRAIYAPFPAYPPAFRSQGVEGRVRATFTIREDGTVSDARVEGAPDPALVAISLNAILRWRFEPLTRQGKPARAQATQEFVFRLK